MNTNSDIRHKSYDSDKVYLGSAVQNRPLLFPAILSLLLLAAISYVLFNSFGIDVITVSITGLCSLILCLIFLRSRLLIATAYLKQNNFVVKYLYNKQAKVMCVKCVRKIQTYRFLGIDLTLVTYNLDGKRHKALLFGKNPEENSPEQLILEAKNAAA